MTLTLKALGIGLLACACAAAPALARVGPGSPETTRLRTAAGGVVEPAPAAAPASREHLVTVWGFRVRNMPYDAKVQSMREGYGTLVGKQECAASACAFLTIRRDNKWYVTSVLAGPDADLQAMAQQVESPDITFVIVHPPAGRLKPPYY
jgi:hypothetical protein